jgi:hypothetical protein
MYKNKGLFREKINSAFLAFSIAFLFVSCTANEDESKQEALRSEEQALESQIGDRLALIGGEAFLVEEEKETIDKAKLAEMDEGIRAGHENMILFKKKLHSLYKQKKSLCPISKEALALKTRIKKALVSFKGKDKDKAKTRLGKLRKIKSLVDAKAKSFFNKEKHTQLTCLSLEDKKIALGKILADIEITRLACGMEKKHWKKKGYHKKHSPLYTGGILRGKFFSKKMHERRDHLQTNKKHHKLDGEKRRHHARKVFTSLASQQCQNAIGGSSQ